MKKHNSKQTVYWAHLHHQSWALYIAATAEGLCYVGSPDAPFDELVVWVKKHLPNYTLRKDEAVMEPYELELIDYLKGKRKEFTLPMDFHGTEFQRTVWEALREIPYGCTVTYTDIAERINRPEAARAVGTAIGANPMLITVPCHRMLGKNGEWRGYRGGLDMKKQLMELEGV